MENTVQAQAGNATGQDSLFLASLILLDVRRMIGNVQVIVAVFLRFATVSVAITNNLIGMVLATVSKED